MIYKSLNGHFLEVEQVEHRQSHRVPAFLDVLIYQRGVPTAAGTLRNVSRDGLFILTDFDGARINQKVDLEFSMSSGGEKQSRRMSAIVVRKSVGGIACECADGDDDCHFLALSDLVYWLKSTRLPE
ncbi:PilZ domain-containing protein [Marinimicrobium sp. ABcell2]|uniref:PilZ domain-containing protein n=1 Tax=Marinimicrobium sp. ABcell2 TaxID=3069751 RepID=UPI00359C7D50